MFFCVCNDVVVKLMKQMKLTATVSFKRKRERKTRKLIKKR